jgi:hypothetical protein
VDGALDELVVFTTLLVVLTGAEDEELEVFAAVVVAVAFDELEELPTLLEVVIGEVMFAEVLVMLVAVMFDEVAEELLVTFVMDAEFCVTVTVEVGAGQVVLELVVKLLLVLVTMLEFVGLVTLVELLETLGILVLLALVTAVIDALEDVVVVEGDDDLASAATPMPIAAIIMMTMTTIAIVEMASLCRFIGFSFNL